MEILYKDLSYKIVGCFYEVYNKLGPGHKEQVYHIALRREFDLKNIKYEDNKKIRLVYKGQKVDIYQPDFIIEDKIIIEIKSVAVVQGIFEKQLFYYLDGSSYKLGYIVNFGSDKPDIRRRIYDSKRNKEISDSREFALDSR